MDASHCTTHRKLLALASLVTATTLVGGCFNPSAMIPEVDGSTGDTELAEDAGDTGGQPMSESTGGTPGDDDVATSAGPGGDTWADSGDTGVDGSTSMPLDSESGQNSDEGTDEGTDDAGSEDTMDDTGSEGTSGNSTTGGAVMCEGANVCVAAPEDGWNGPVALHDIELDGLPDCGGDFPDLQVDDAFGGLVAPDFACDCSCTAGSLACDGSAFVEVSNSQNITNQSPCNPGNGGNNGLVGGVTVTPANPFDSPSGALDVTASLIHGVTVENVTTEVIGDCVEVPSETPTEAAFTERTAACGATLVDAECGGGDVCVAQPSAPFEAELCVWAEGEQSCPAAYPVQQIRHREIDDQRGCSECSCGGADASCSDPTVGMSYWYTLFVIGGAVPILTNPLSMDAPSNYCSSIDLEGEGNPYNSTHSLGQISFDPGTLDLDNPGAPCPAFGGDPVGEATPSDALTICCTEA